MACPYEKSVDGIEMQFATNHLGHFLLVNLLREKISGEGTRVVCVASSAYAHGGVRFEDWNFEVSCFIFCLLLVCLKFVRGHGEKTKGDEGVTFKLTLKTEWENIQRMARLRAVQNSQYALRTLSRCQTTTLGRFCIFSESRLYFPLPPPPPHLTTPSKRMLTRTQQSAPPSKLTC